MDNSDTYRSRRLRYEERKAFYFLTYKIVRSAVPDETALDQPVTERRWLSVTSAR